MSDRLAQNGADTRLVSIVVPTYNRERLLSAALEACLAQTWRNIEVIVVDDGSTDRTADVLARWAAAVPRVRPFHKENGGIADALNFGHACANGEFVTWTSDDNVYYPEAIARMAAFLQAHPGVGMVYTDVRFIDAQDKVIRVVEAPEPAEMESRCCVQGCLLYRREVVEKVGKFRSRWVRCQDYDFYIRVSRAFQIARLPEVLYDYRWHEASMSGNHEAHMLEDAELLASHARTRHERRAVWAHHLGYLGRHFENRWQHWRAAGYYLRAVPYAPGRARDTIRTAAYAAYGSLPSWMRRAWRAVKRMCAGRARLAPDPE